MESKKNRIMISAFAICIVSAALVSATASAVSLPFEISGYVFNADGSACNGPTIAITNLNTGETFSTMTLPSSNYYCTKPAPSLDDVSEGNVLQFNVTAGLESGAIEHHISALDLNRAALQFNITISEGGAKGGSVVEGEQTPPMPPLPGGPNTTPVTTPTPEEEGQAPTATPTTAPSEEEEGKGIPGFEAVYAIIGFIATILYLTLRRKGGGS
ncbi:MAG: hypothetical protein ANIMEMIM_00158 [Candidatus Argoarchaeum ethanivorans]|uniref:PGF-CTERM archaeal protein-sorting signal domain-containing protein n=1 Tax=Candidatus Argoarchaeum ethanivorans TaxID=2608793 RepID=A0A811T6M6_9EURY|nr:MAG: hypothetical protein ANIMEMIM_00158 [Candidatus Argoarchaeum ethanivorans]